MLNLTSPTHCDLKVSGNADVFYQRQMGCRVTTVWVWIWDQSKIHMVNPCLLVEWSVSLVAFDYQTISSTAQGSILSTKIWVQRNFLTKIWKFWTHQFFQNFSRPNVLVQMAGKISENLFWSNGSFDSRHMLCIEDPGDSRSLSKQCHAI